MNIYSSLIAKNSNNFKFLFFMWTVIGCSPYHIYVSKTSPSLVKDIDFIFPLSDVFIIKDQNEMILSDTLSSLCGIKAFNALIKNKREFKLAEHQALDDEVKFIRLKIEVKNIVDLAEKYGHVEYIEYPLIFDTLFSSKGNRFVMSTYTKGFVRTKKNNVDQRIDDILVTLLTAGNVLKYSYSYYTVHHILIFDTVNQKITFCGRKQADNSILDTVSAYSENFRDILSGYIVD